MMKRSSPKVSVTRATATPTVTRPIRVKEALGKTKVTWVIRVYDDTYFKQRDVQQLFIESSSNTNYNVNLGQFINMAAISINSPVFKMQFMKTTPIIRKHL